MGADAARLGGDRRRQSPHFAVVVVVVVVVSIDRLAGWLLVTRSSRVLPAEATIAYKLVVGLVGSWRRWWVGGG